MERLYILDGHGYIFRAYYGLMTGTGQGVHLSTSGGMPTGALYVYASMLLRLYLDENPQRIVVVFDAPGKSFRAELDPQYKAHRKEMPEDLKVQMPFFQPLTEAFSWPVVAVPGVEADDVIATLTRQARTRGMDVTVYSADKDLMQLVDDHVNVIDAMRQIRYDVDRVVEKFGVSPSQLADWLALVGDASDNIPGMAGVGKKTATKLLQQYGSIDGILANTAELKGKQKERFEDAALLQRLELSRKLVALVTDVDVGKELDELRRGEWDGAGLERLFQELDFKGLVDRLEPVDANEPAQQAGEQPAAVVALEVVADRDRAVALFAAAREAGRFSLHVETDALRPVRANVVGVAVAVPGRAPAYLPIAHRYLSAPPQLAVDDFVAAAKAVLEDASVGKVCHHAKSAQTHLARLGIELDGVAVDTMLAAYLIDASTDADALPKVLGRYGDAEVPSRVELVGKGKKARGFDAVSVEQAADYACGVAAALLRAAEVVERRMADDGLTRLHDEVELPLARLLSRIERVGVLVDVSCLRKLADRVGGQIAQIEAKVHELAGDVFNLGSPKQLGALLFEKLQLESPRMKKTKTGYSTDHEVLDAMRDMHPIVPLLLEHRELVKLKGTYIDALPPLVNPETGRLHTSFRQAVAATGRLSSSDPNLQNIPIRTELGREIRRAFVAGEGKLLVSCDYSQIELRLLAHYCQDPVLLAAFRDGVDIHAQTAAEVFEIELDAVGPLERRVAKAVNYGLLYGQSGFGLSRALDIPRGEAQAYIEKYFSRFTVVQSFLDGIIEQARRDGYSTTILGRRRPIPELNSRNFRLRSAAERVARNTPLQGSGADILKLAMLRAQKVIDDDGLDARMLLTVHDELVFEAGKADAEAIGARMKKEMETVYALEVPLEVDVGVADNWADAH